MVSLNGMIILPTTAAGIADAATVDVIYDAATLTREQYHAFSKLNRSGKFRLYLEDETGLDAREIWDFEVANSRLNRLAISTRPNSARSSWTPRSLVIRIITTRPN